MEARDAHPVFPRGLPIRSGSLDGGGRAQSFNEPVQDFIEVQREQQTRQVVTQTLERQGARTLACSMTAQRQATRPGVSWTVGLMGDSRASTAISLAKISS